MTTIGLFDSGVGGLSVLLAVRALLRQANVLYFGDSFHAPYGARPDSLIRQYSQAITQFVLQRDAQLVVVACNTASAVALQYLRHQFPGVPFVGMEPAIKPAVQKTRTQVVGVIATPATLEGDLFNASIHRFAQGITVLKQVCPGLVEAIEAGRVDTEDTEMLLRVCIEPLLAQQMDVLVLGCTHYPFVKPLLHKICGPAVAVIDPAPAVARQVARLLPGNGAPTVGQVTYYTTGAAASLRRLIRRLELEPGEVHEVNWIEGEIQE